MFFNLSDGSSISKDRTVRLSQGKSEVTGPMVPVTGYLSWFNIYIPKTPDPVCNTGLVTGPVFPSGEGPVRALPWKARPDS